MPESTTRGALTEAVFYILLSLYKPTHGYGIMKFIRQKTNDRVIIGSGTLYGALDKLIKNEWIQIINLPTDSKKHYQITEIGKLVVDMELGRLKELIIDGESISKA